MTEVLPFKGILYNTSRVSGEDVVAPPYDIITPEMKEVLYSKSPFNIVKIDFGKDHPGDNDSNNRYTRARFYMDTWLSDGILKESEKPSYYLYEVNYRSDGIDKVMRGLFARVRLTELCKGVYPHEATHSKPKADRLNLMRYCKANISPIFAIYSSPNRGYLDIFEKTISSTPYITAKDNDGATHKMWIIDKPDDVELIRNELKDISIYIADGHHRYETALEFQREMMNNNPSHYGNEPYNYVLMYLVNTADDGLTILPTHRLLKDFSIVKTDAGEYREGIEGLLAPLERYFEILELDPDTNIVSEIAGRRHALGLVIHGYHKNIILHHRGGALKEVPEPIRDLDVAILHEVILKKIFRVKEIEYEMDPLLALKKVREGDCRAAFFLNPTRTEDVERVARACLRMPPKSTYFYPKILNGFVINRLT
jgi:uncharacterized protein (DUF1015 family)